eukprot:5593687-Amphidinium_carterae.1
MPPPLAPVFGHQPWNLGELQPLEPHFFTDFSASYQQRNQKLAAWAYIQFTRSVTLLAVAEDALTPSHAFESTVYEAELRALHAVVIHTDWDITVGGL